jgi:hypothetical protein
MTEEAKTDKEKVQEAADKALKAADKALVDEIADIDFTGKDEPLKDPTEDSKTTDGEKDDKTVDDGKESKEDLDDEKKEKEDTKTSEKKEGEEGSPDDKGAKPKEPKEGEKKVDVSQVDKLLVEINRLSGLVEPEKETPPKKEGEDEKPKEEELKKETEIDLSSYDFIKDIDMDDVSSDPQVFNRILHDVIKKVQLQTTEQVLRSIPQVVMSQVNQQTYFKRMADKFYEDNPDLVHVRQVVKACTQQVQQTNPEWEIEKVLKEAAIKTRSTLGMAAHKIEDDSEVPSAEDAAFGKSRGGSKSNLKQRKSSLQTEIDEL